MFWLLLFLSFPAGALLGAFFFGGLWWTVQRMADAERPYLLALASFLLRTATVLAGFYFLLTAGWPFLLTALTGFIAARTVLTLRLRHEGGPPPVR